MNITMEWDGFADGIRDSHVVVDALAVALSQTRTGDF